MKFESPIKDDTKGKLRSEFIEPPFSILNAKTAHWQQRKKIWQKLGIKSEIGRNDDLTFNVLLDEYRSTTGSTTKTSIFDPALTELMYKWFCSDKGNILDPFAGGSVRGIVANYLNYHYIGIELSQEQVDANRDNASEILPVYNQPNWYCGDSDQILNDKFVHDFDFIFSCPPYMSLEVYSDNINDLSNMNDDLFIAKYNSIIKKSCLKLKKGCFACFVVGDIRDKKTGYYKDFITITKNAFYQSGLKLYNEMIFMNLEGSASLRARGAFKSNKKITKVHQNVLVFIKP